MKVQVRQLVPSVSDNICLLDSMTLNSLKIDAAEPFKIHLGQLSVTCMINSCSDMSPVIYVPENIINNLLLPDNITLNIWRKDNNIYLGPVVGMFLTRRAFSSCSKAKPIKIIIEHIKEASPFSSCLGYCFCIDGVDFEGSKIKGYTFVEKLNRWELRWFPLPDVIYDRTVNLEDDERDLARKIRQEFSINPKIKFINPPGSLGKWPLHKKLSGHSEMRNYLPHTILYKTFDGLLNMLDKYNFIFLKSSFGSQGKEVLSIEKIDGKYRVDFYNRSVKICFAEDIPELKTYIENFIRDKKALGRDSFIVQQGIRLLKYKGHNIIFRIDVVKNENGEWETINPYGTYSRDESNITNFSVGGVETPFAEIYPKLQLMNSSISLPTQEEIMKSIIKIASSIERFFGPYGEMGIDVVLDEDGRLWLLESNSKPDKCRIPGLDDMSGVAPQALAIFNYSKYLAIKRR